MKENNGKYLLLDEMNSFQLLTFHIIRQEDIYKENNFPLMMSKMSYLKTYYHFCLFLLFMPIFSAGFMHLVMYIIICHYFL